VRTPSRTLLLPLLLGLTVAACSGGGGSVSSLAATPGETAPAASSAAPVSTDPSTGSTTTKVNANTASVDQLQIAFEAAGISNADRWAREVAEYRPYQADPTWAQLRQELAKYNIAPDVLEKIIAVLEV
jgi:competence protein ComEA